MGGEGTDPDRAHEGGLAEERLARLSRRFLSLDADAIDDALREHLPFAADLAGADRTFLLVVDPVAARVQGAYAWTRPGAPTPPAIPPDPALGERFAWSRGRIAAGEVTQVGSPEALPPEAENERRMMRERGCRSMLIVPVRSGERLIGGQLFETVSAERVWTEREINALQLLGEIFASAIERRHAELALRESEARFRAFAENAMELVSEFDEQGVYLYASPSFRELLGHDPESLLGCSSGLLVHPDDLAAARRRFRDAFGAADGSASLHRLRHADGSWRWFENTGRAYAAADGSRRFVSVGRDVTGTRSMVEAMERQLAIEKKIAALSRRFLALETSALDDAVMQAIEEAGAVAGADRAYLYSATAEGDSPYQRHYEWLGDGAAPFRGARRPWAEAKLAAGEVLHFDRPEDVPAEAVEERKSLERRGVKSVLAIPLRTGGRFSGVIGFEAMRTSQHWSDHDIALLRMMGEIMVSSLERQRTEAVLRESELKLHELQKLEAVGRLAGGIAHDFNNLLTVILGFSRPLLRELPEDDPVRADVAEIHGAAERAAGLTRQLLTYSSRKAVDETFVDLGAVLEGLSPLIARLLGEDIEIVLSLAPELRAVKGDPHQFEQIVVNLAANARDAMPDGGQLELSTANRRLEAEDARRLGLAGPGEHVLLTVRDSGEGMDEEIRSRIFDPFFTTKDPGKGTGLGLAIVFSVVERAGGAIEVSGAPGKGSCFEIWLPAAAGAAQTVRADPPAPAPGGSETVLLVEDEAAVRRLTRGILAGAGYRVLEAVDGEDALAVAASFDGPIDLLVSDVVMPRLGGYALARRLAALRPELKTLLVSGYPDGQGSEDASGLPVLRKPFDAEVLLTRARALLD